MTEVVVGRELPLWYRDAKFGLFVHWTVGSVPAFAPLGKDPFALAREEGEFAAFARTPYAEWYWNSASIPGSPAALHHERVWNGCDYGVFVERFFDAARGWDPLRWERLMRASGARYCVMVTKHHDGVLLWPSDLPNPHRGAAWSSPRDLVGECAAAARRAGLRFGAYYSGGLDWTFGGLGIDGWRKLFSAIPQSDAYREYANAHYRELVRRYAPDVLWNDIGYPGGAGAATPLVDEFYAANPDGVVNDRFDLIGVVQGTMHADFRTVEYSSGGAPAGRSFEVCRGIGASFGYVADESEDRCIAVHDLVRLLVDTVADGGNLLLNIGPMPGGEVPWMQASRVLALGEWLAVNGDAIYASRPHPLGRLATDDGTPVRLTSGADGAAYAIVCGRTASERVRIEGLPPGQVQLLGHRGALRREADAVMLPARPSEHAVFTLRIS